MNILELDSFNLADAVKFNDQLNPRIWQGTNMRPEVREKLLEIAADFKEFLGLGDLDVKDITVSGSNAAYTYTPQSDIDLHLVVDIPRADQDEVYRELFDAKKYQYNDLHNIRIGGYDVELYVENANKPPVSKGVFSVLNNDWISIPRQRKATVDDDSVRSKYEDIKHRIEDAVKSGDAERIDALAKKIKAYRQAGLDKHGELGSENLAYKMLRNQGYIEKLYKARSAARDAELSLAEQNKEKKPFVYGYKTVDEDATLTPDGVSASTKMFLSEKPMPSHTEIIFDFMKFAVHALELHNVPKLKIRKDPQWSIINKSFGRYRDDIGQIDLAVGNRHIMDVLRTLAHELQHRKQDEREHMPPGAGETGSRFENEAHAVAGVLMRKYADLHPEYFEDVPVNEASGYIPTKAQANDPRFKMALTVDVHPGQTGKEANKLALKTNTQGEPELLIKSANLLKEFQEFKHGALTEEQALFEINMSPSSLRAEAAKTGAMAGMEFEMIVPNVNVDSEPEYEPDYDQDQRTRSFSDIRDFFYDGDYNSRRDVDRLIEEMENEFFDWQAEQIDEAWDRDGFEFFTEYLDREEPFDPTDYEDRAEDEVKTEYPDLDPESDEFEQLKSQKLQEIEANYYTETWEAQGRVYDHAREEFDQEQRDNIDESDWLQEHYPYMTDVNNSFDISWPYYIDINEGNGDMDIESVADDFGRAVGKKVNWSSSYHGGRREPNAYVVEPDGSLDPDDSDDGGLEFVSPPMPIDEMIDQLNKVKAWAGDYGCYTNKSTGLHINISVPNYDLAKLDYVKLALLLGDKYVLDQYGRSSNTYAKSALGKVQELIKRDPSKGKELLDKMRGHMEDLATKSIHSGTTDKYTSINTKTGYIEFRSPGGDWLDANFDKVENTLMRFTVALSAAMNPEAYREEYLKKLYKLLEPVAEEARGIAGKGAKDTVKYFADYVAGKTPKAALRSFVKQAQLERRIKRGQTGDEKMWWNVEWTNGRRMEVVAGSAEVAKQVAAEEWGVPESQLADAKVTAIRPYDQTPAKVTTGAPEPIGQQGNWGIWMTGANRFSRAPGQTDNSVLRRFPSREAAEQWIEQTRAERPDMRTDIEVREIEPGQQSGPTAGGRASNPDGNWIIAPQGQNPPVPLFRFNAAGVDDANTVVNQWNREHSGQEVVVHYDPQQRYGQPPIPGSTLDLQRQRAAAAQQRTADQQQGGTVDVAGETPAATGQFTGNWRILDAQGREIHRFGGIGNSQSDANNFAIRWLQQNPRYMQAGVEVVPEMA